MELNLKKVKSYVGSKNKMVFDSPKFWRKPNQGEEGGWKQICGAMDYFLLPVDEDRIDMEKQWELGMAQPIPFKFEQENMRPWLAEF